MTTQKQIVENSNIPATLTRAVIKQLGGWSSFKGSAPDIANHGIDGGYCGFVYYTDTVAFFKRNRRDIVELAKQQADDFGMGVLEMVAGFNCLNGDYSTDEIGETLFGGPVNDQIANALAWYAGEEVARVYADMQD